MTTIDRELEYVFVQKLGHTLGKQYFSSICWRDKFTKKRITSGSPYFAKCTTCGMVLFGKSKFVDNQQEKWCWVGKWNKERKDFDPITRATIMFNLNFDNYFEFQEYECHLQTRLKKARALK